MSPSGRPVGNEVRIDITVAEHDQLGQIAAKGERAGERVRKAFESATGNIDRAFDKTSKQLANQLDKIEKEAWESGRGMDDAFGTALTGLRKSLGLVRTEAAETGAGLHSNVGTALAEVRKGADQLAASLKPVTAATVEVNKAFDKTARLVGVELDRIERDAWLAGKGTDAAFQAALSNVRDDFERVRDVGRRTGASLESELGGSLRDIKREMDQLGDEARQTGQEIKTELGDALQGSGTGFGDMLSQQVSGGFDLGGMLEGMTGGAGGGIAAAGAALGTAIAAAEWQAFNAYFDQRSLAGVISAQQGGTSAEAGKLGRVAGMAYYTGFADTMEEGNAALSGVLGQGLVSTDDSEAEIQKLTSMASTAARVVGEDANMIARAATQLIRNGLAGNAQEAMDLIVRSSQVGVNRAGDLIDTIEEYSTKFRDMGLTGSESLGLLNQALDAGARDADIAADSIKEFSIRAIDGSEATARGFRTLGLDARQMGQDIGAGGDTARDALDKTLDGLRDIEDPVLRNQAAVDLFGTTAEDLGDALFAMDLDTVSSQMDGVAGSTENAAKVMQDSMSPIDKLGRGFEGSVQMVIGGMSSFRDEVSLTGDGLRKTADQSDRFKSESAQLADKLDRAKEATDGITEASGYYAETLNEIISAQEQLSGSYMDAEQAQMGYQAAIDAANESLVANGKNTDISTEKGRDNKQSLLELNSATWDVIGSMEAQGSTAEQVRGFMQSARDEFVNTAIAMGYSADEANGMADKLRLIPGEYVAEVRASTDNAQRKLKEMELYINHVTRQRTLVVNAVGSGLGIPFWGRESGGITPHRAWGAQSGGARHSSTVVNEAGPELIELEDGSRVMTAGATMAMAQAGLLGGGGGAVHLSVSFDGSSDPIIRAMMEGLRFQVQNRYGGSVQKALGKAGVG
jgi:phage-related minor tail protein